MAPITLVDIPQDGVDPANPPYPMELSFGYFGVHPLSCRNELPHPRQNSEDTPLKLTRRDVWFQPWGLPISSRVGKRAPDAKKPDPNAELSASSLGERARTQLGGPFAVGDLSKRGNPVLHGGRLDRAPEVRDVWARKDDEKKEKYPLDSSTWVVNDLVARTDSQYYKQPLIDRRASDFEEVSKILDAGPRGFDDSGPFTEKDIRTATWLVSIGVVVLIIAVSAISIWGCYRCCRKAITKRQRLCRHRAPPKANVPEITQTTPADDFEPSLAAVEPATGPAIADQLPVDDTVDRATGKRVSFNVPGDDTLVKDFGSPSKRSVDEPGNGYEREASPASPR